MTKIAVDFDLELHEKAEVAMNRTCRVPGCNAPIISKWRRPNAKKCVRHLNWQEFNGGLPLNIHHCPVCGWIIADEYDVCPPGIMPETEGCA